MYSFDTYAQKKIVLDAELALIYRDRKNFSIACIKNSFDITDLEAYRYLEAVEEFLEKFIDGYDIEHGVGRVGGGSVVVNDYMGSF